MGLLIGAIALAAIFGPLSLIAWVIKKAIARRKRLRQINAMFMNLPLRQARPTEGPTAPRVLYVPKHEEEPETHEADVVVPAAFIGWEPIVGDPRKDPDAPEWAKIKNTNEVVDVSQ